MNKPVEPIATAWWSKASLQFELDPCATGGPGGTLLVGIGTDTGAGAVVLNHKTVQVPNDDARPGSVTQLVLEADAETLAGWRARLGSSGGIERIVVEDFSLDTCFATLAFAALLDGRQLAGPASLQAWSTYVTDWEDGYYADGEDLEASPACLLSALGHSYFSDSYAGAVTNGFVAEAMRTCLGFLDLLVRGHDGPGVPPGVRQDRAFLRARAHLVQERELYRMARERAECCQLLMPLADSQRRVVADTLILEEAVPSGALKIMARTDTANTWTRKGYAVLAFHRPGEAGTGNDMVISSMPESGIRLGPLWQALELAENAGWAGQRPTDKARWLESYRDPSDRKKLLPGSPNQPWYDDKGHYTLLAAPKLVADGVPGTRLDWYDDVLPLLWKTGFEDVVQSIVREAPSGSHLEDGPRIRLVEFQASAKGAMHPDMAILETPTFHRWLAAAGQVRSPLDLPPLASIQVLHFGQDLAVVHAHGVTFFRRSSQGQKQFEGLLETARLAAATSHDYRGFLAKHMGKLAEWGETLATGHDKKDSKTPSQEEWAHEIHTIRAAALRATSSASLLRADYEEGRLSEALQERWCISRRRGEVLELVDRLDSLMTHAIHARTARRQRVYGSLLSALSLGFVAEHIWEPIKETRTVNSFEWQLKLFKETPAPSLEELSKIAHDYSALEHTTVAIVLGFTALGFLLYWVFDIRGGGGEH